MRVNTQAVLKRAQFIQRQKIPKKQWQVSCAVSCGARQQAHAVLTCNTKMHLCVRTCKHTSVVIDSINYKAGFRATFLTCLTVYPSLSAVSLCVLAGCVAAEGRDPDRPDHSGRRRYGLQRAQALFESYPASSI